MLGAAELYALLQRHDLVARRSLGQNFVVDPGTLRRMVAIAGVRPGSSVIEIGPGVGSLTLALVEAGAHVVAVEKDPALLPVLEEVLSRVPAPERPRVFQADALTVDWSDLMPPSDGEVIVVANLPYNVAVPIVIGVLRRAPGVRRLVVMVQAEVAERLCASPGGRTIGVPTIKVGWYASARVVMHVPPEVFVPRPRVHSAVLDLVRHAGLGTECEADQTFALVELAYHQRRKMLRSTLSTRVRPEDYERAGVEPTWRPERLTPTQWAVLAGAVLQRGPLSC